MKKLIQVSTLVFAGIFTLTGCSKNVETLLAAKKPSASLTLIYDGNGNTGGTAPVDSGSPYSEGTLVTVASEGDLVKAGNSFTVWNSAADGSGTSYSAGSTFTMGSSDLTLYAQWGPPTYAVTYNGNGSTGGAAPIDTNSPYENAETVTVKAAGTLVKTGHSFAGWNTAADGSGTSYAAAATFSMGTAPIVLYAQWTVSTYAITYNGNGNTGGAAPSDSSSPYAYGSTVTTMGGGTLAKTGHSFAGWNTAANGGGTNYAVGATFTMGAAPVTLYARWTVNSYAVTYNSNGATSGSVPTDSRSPYSYNSTVTVMGVGTLVRTGYDFVGWNTASNGSGTSYTAGGTFTMGASAVILYARWSLKTYSLVYDGNGNTGGTAPTDSSSPYLASATVTVMGQGSLVKEANTFMGWSLTAGGAVAYTAAQTFSMPSSDRTLYAKWVQYDYYIATTGNDTTGTGTKAAPFATISKALSSILATAVAGNYSVHVAGGTYPITARMQFKPAANLGLSVLGGYDSSFTTRDSSANPTIIESTQSGTNIGFELGSTNASAVTNPIVVDGFTIRMNNTGSSSVYAFFLDYARNYTISNNVVEVNCGSPSDCIGVYYSPNSGGSNQRLTIRNNSFAMLNSTTPGMIKGLGTSVYSGNTGLKIEVYNNTFYISARATNYTLGIITAVSGATNSVVIRNNTIVHPGVTVTTDRPSTSSMFIGGDPSLASVDNNIMYTTTATGAGIGWAGSAATLGSFKNNNIARATTIACAGTDAACTTAMNLAAVNALAGAANNISQDPSFVNNLSDWNLTSGSPSAVQTGGLDGSALSWGFTIDKAGATRSGNGSTGWSMGAYEY